MFMPFRDGLQSSFGGKVRLNDYLPAMKLAADVGIRHMEFGGGARYQAPYFYLGENPFETMQSMRDAVGNDVELQILTRSVSGVTLTTQSMEGLSLQAKLMQSHGTTWDRNFDYMNDVENLINYMLCSFYAGDFDAPVSNFLGNNSPNNFYGIYNRRYPNGFFFFRISYRWMQFANGFHPCVLRSVWC